jgi:SPP1 family phage portal protein
VEIENKSGQADTITKLEIYDGRYIIYAIASESGDSYELDQDEAETGNPIEHKAGRIPVSVFINASAAKYDTRIRRAGTSDLGNGVFTLLEAYAHGLSDKANLADYLQDQYLLLKGVDTDEKEVLKMRKARAIALKSKDSDASFIAQDQADGAVENYLNRLRDTIHDMTFTPKVNDLSGATATEIKMKYAPLDIKAGKKEVFFVVALKQLIQVLTDFLNVRKLGENAYETLKDKEAMAKRTDLYKAEWLTIKLNRNLPQNYKEIADIVAELSGKVPDGYLIELLWFVDDPVKALEELKQQKQQALKDNMLALGYSSGFSDTGSAGGDGTGSNSTGSGSSKVNMSMTTE